MNKIKGQTGLANILNISVTTVNAWINRGLPYTREGFTYYFERDAVITWLRSESVRKYGHLVDVLDNYIAGNISE